jgi:predicted DNA-binding transcriptional regulator
MTEDIASGLGVVGLSPEQERVYRAVLGRPAATVEEVAERTGLPTAAVTEAVAGLQGLGMLEPGAVGAAGLTARPPAETLGRLLAAELQRWRAVGERLDLVRDSILPGLQAEHLSGTLPVGHPVAMEVVEGAELPALLDSLAHGSSGELLWMRPDNWREREYDRVESWVRAAVAGGRRSRVLYPARVLEEAPEVLQHSAEAGEQFRILADVPCRLAVLGDAAALLPAEQGAPSSRRLVVRHPTVVAALRLVVETLWEKAMAVPGLDAHRDRQEALSRGLLLDLLADGAKDEQISRELGLSLRTVRRRVADLLDELGADSRFQAGVEAVRRGWV